MTCSSVTDGMKMRATLDHNPVNYQVMCQENNTQQKKATLGLHVDFTMSELFTAFPVSSLFFSGFY